MFSLTINSSTRYMSSMYQIKCVVHVLLCYSYLMWLEGYTFGNWNANELIRIHKQNYNNTEYSEVETLMIRSSN